jgi:HEAT repeats
VLDRYNDVKKAYVAYIRQSVFAILPEIDPEPNLALIRNELKLDHEHHRAAIVGTLSQYRGSTVIDLVVEALDDTSPAVQNAALDVLSKIADEKIIPRIELLLGASEDNNVRQAALRALSAITVGAFDWMKASDYSFYDRSNEQRRIEKALLAWREWREANLDGFSSLRARKELVSANTPDLQQGVSADLLLPAARCLLESGDESGVQIAKAFLKSCADSYSLEVVRMMIRARDPLGIELAIKLFERGDSGGGTYAERLLARATGVSMGRLVFGASEEKAKEIGRKWREWWEANREGFKFDR